jgi:MoaA/NifB/PqqE/SkfB family radical SAM enzyme
MKNLTNFWAEVDEQGRLILPAEVVNRFGLETGAQVFVEEEANHLRLHRSLSHLARIYIEPTDRCNLNCAMCIRQSWQESMGMMAKDTFEHLLAGIRALPAPPSVCFSGFGEPLAHPDIVEMVSGVKSFSQNVELITNGMLLTQALSSQLLEAGLDMLWVSLDSANPDVFADVRLGANLADIFQNIRRFSQARNQLGRPEVKIGIAFVAMKRNIAELPQLLRMSGQLGASRFIVTNVLPYTPEYCNEVLYARTLNDIAYYPSSYAPQLEMPRIDLNEATHNPLYQVMRTGCAVTTYGDKPGRGTNSCPFIARGSTAIAWDGGVSPCLSLLHTHTSYLNKRERHSKRYVIGNVNAIDLGILWNSTQYMSFRERVQTFDFSPCTVCGGCDMSLANEEDCFGNTFPTCGGCLWAQGVIQCP